MRCEAKKRTNMLEISQCTAKPNINVVKELVEPKLPIDNIVKLQEEASRLIKGKTKGKDIGTPVLPCYFGGSIFSGLCTLDLVINVITYSY